jgi:hypothetical protein
MGPSNPRFFHARSRSVKEAPLCREDPAAQLLLVIRYDRRMAEKRSWMARILAGAIALGGTSEVITILTAIVAVDGGIILAILLLPGWFAYFALIWTAIGRRLPGDPFTTWIPCILINGFWLLGFAAHTDFHLSTKAFAYIYIRTYVLAAVLGGIAGLILELRLRASQRPAAAEPSNQFGKAADSKRSTCR